MKKKGVVVLAACVLLAGIVAVIAFNSAGKKPYKDLDASQIASATVRLLPPNKTIPITETEELVEYLKNVVIHHEDNPIRSVMGKM